MKDLNCPKCGKNIYHAVKFNDGASLICQPCHLVVYNIHGRIMVSEVEVNTDYRIIKAWKLSMSIASAIFGASLGLFPLIVLIPAMLVPLGCVASSSGFWALASLLIRRTFEHKKGITPIKW